jgi:hypothetical protein
VNGFKKGVRKKSGDIPNRRKREGRMVRDLMKQGKIPSRIQRGPQVIRSYLEEKDWKQKQNKSPIKQQ